MDDDTGESYPTYPESGSSTRSRHIMSLPPHQTCYAYGIFGLSNQDSVFAQANPNSFPNGHELTLSVHQQNRKINDCDEIADSHMYDELELDDMANNCEDVQDLTTSPTLQHQVPNNYATSSLSYYLDSFDAADQGSASTYSGTSARPYSDSLNFTSGGNNPSYDDDCLLDLVPHNNPLSGNFSSPNFFTADQSSTLPVNRSHRLAIHSEYSKDMGHYLGRDFDHNDGAESFQHNNSISHVGLAIAQSHNNLEHDEDVEPEIDVSDNVDYRILHDALFGEEAKSTQQLTDTHIASNQNQSSNTAPSASKKRKRNPDPLNVVPMQPKKSQLSNLFQVSTQPGCILVRPGLPGGTLEDGMDRISIHLCSELWVRILQFLDIKDYLILYHNCPNNTWLRETLSDGINLSNLGIPRIPARMSTRTYMSLLAGSGCMTCNRRPQHKKVSWPFALRLCKTCRSNEVASVSTSEADRDCSKLIYLLVR
jgi:hypothetical protein